MPAQKLPNTGGNDSATGAHKILSPQQIMRARFKQQTMPPRTWRQQQARQEQIDAISTSRLTQNRSLYTAAAAKASRTPTEDLLAAANAQPSLSHERPVSKPLVESSSESDHAIASPESMQATTTSNHPQTNEVSVRIEEGQVSRSDDNAQLWQGRRRSGTTPAQPTRRLSFGQFGPYNRVRQNSNASFTSSHSSDSPSKSNLACAAASATVSSHAPLSAARPPLSRRSSSTSSISRAAAIAAQLPHNHDGPPSRVSSLSSSRRSSTSVDDDSTASTTTLQIQPAIIEETPGSPRSTMRNTSRRSSAQSLKALGSPATIATSAGARASQNAKVRAHASAAARASASTPIDVAPRQTLSAKFVSSLTQALRTQEEQRKRAEDLEQQRAQAVRAIENTVVANVAQHKLNLKSALSSPAGRKSSESQRSVTSNMSALSQRSGRSQTSRGSAEKSSPLDRGYALTRDSFAELQHQQQQQQAEQEQRRLKTAKENKANALRAAVAAGIRVESDMASIHMQVNDAVRTAQERRSARIKRYRPAASWTAPVRLFKPQLGRLQTSDSTKSATLVPDVATPGGQVSTPAETPKSWPYVTTPATEVNSDPMAAIGEVPEKQDSQSVVGIPPSPHPSSQHFSQLTLRTATRFKREPNSRTESRPAPIQQAKQTNSGAQWQNTVGPRPPSDLHSSSSSPAGSTKSSLSGMSAFEKNVGFGFHNRSDDTDANLTQPPNAVIPPAPPRMPKTLRGGESRKRFNEEKPWKGHREITQLSERERKRYESLWAANRDVHLPFLYVPLQYEQEWKEALAIVHPNLVKLKSNSSGSDMSSPAPVTKRTTYANSVRSMHSARSGHSAQSVSSMSSARSSHFDGEAAFLNDLKAPTRFRTPESDHFYDCNMDGSEVADRPHSQIVPGFDETTPRPDGETLPSSRISESQTEPSRLSSVSSRESEAVEVESPEIEGHVDMIAEVERRSDEVHGYIAARLWRRSRLQEETLAQIWELVDTNKDGTLERSGFVVGMWLCDQCLYGRKLPRRVPPEVWQSAGKLNLKIRVKQPRSKVGYVRQLPNLLSSAVGYTMHGSRNAVKKAVQTATK